MADRLRDVFGRTPFCYRLLCGRQLTVAAERSILERLLDLLARIADRLHGRRRLSGLLCLVAHLVFLAGGHSRAVLRIFRTTGARDRSQTASLLLSEEQFAQRHAWCRAQAAKLAGVPKEGLAARLAQHWDVSVAEAAWVVSALP